MIKLQEYTPDIYYKESRDFQLIGRLFDLVLNSVKTEVDLLHKLPISDNSNDKLLDLMLTTFGFKAKHKYSVTHLRAICSVFQEAVRNKGSIRAILILCNAIFTADGFEQTVAYSMDNENAILTLYVPESFTDLVLLNDLLDYFLPAGISCRIIRELQVHEKANTELTVMSTFNLYANGDEYNIEEGSAEKIYKYKYNNNLLAKIPDLVYNNTADRVQGQVSINDIIRGLVNDNVGFIANGIVYKPDIEDTEGENNNG